MKTSFLSVLGLLMLGALTGCADDGHTRLIRVGGDSTARGVSNPATLTVEPGTEVRWHNIGAHSHILIGGAAENGADPVDSFEAEWGPSRLVPGATISHIFENEGSYVYWLGESRTFGTIIVEAPS